MGNFNELFLTTFFTAIPWSKSKNRSRQFPRLFIFLLVRENRLSLCSKNGDAICWEKKKLSKKSYLSQTLNLTLKMYNSYNLIFQKISNLEIPIWGGREAWRIFCALLLVYYLSFIFVHGLGHCECQAIFYWYLYLVLNIKKMHA